MARWLAAFALTSALAAGASAHEPPKGIDLQWSGDAPDELPVIVTNRGLVFADAMGGTTRFSLRCAEAYGANTSDHPGVSVGADGQITIGIYNGVSATSDRACSLHPSAGLPDEPLGTPLEPFNTSAGGILSCRRITVQPKIEGEDCCHQSRRRSRSEFSRYILRESQCDF